MQTTLAPNHAIKTNSSVCNSAVSSLQTTTSDVLSALKNEGWVLLRGQNYKVDTFSQLMRQLCQTLTYDPARQNITSEAQKVDAGPHAIGLHIENGNTPMPPDVIAFFSELSASKGSQTTMCDGYAVYQALSPALKQLFMQPMRISRYLPKLIWQTYVATALKREDIESISLEDLKRFIDQTTSQTLTHFIEPQADGGVRYILQIPAIREDNLSSKQAFANTILGPSFNYEKPEFTLADGSSVDNALIDELTQICEAYTQEITWQNGDVLVLDNKRIMHGRRQIEVALTERKLYVAMGLGIH